MNSFETASEYRAAFDALLAGTHRLLRLYDRDLGLPGLDEAPRHAALRAFCVAGGGRRIEVLLDDISQVVREHPRLMQLVRDFGHVVEIRHADPDAPRPDQAFALSDRHGLLLRADKSAVPGSFHPDDPAAVSAWQQTFESMWQRSPAAVSATTLGL